MQSQSGSREPIDNDPDSKRYPSEETSLPKTEPVEDHIEGYPILNGQYTTASVSDLIALENASTGNRDN